MKTIIGLALGGLAGGLLGYYQVFCPTGRCALTGSWYGGAILGALLGVLLVGGCPACAAGKRGAKAPADEPDRHSPDGA